MDGSTDERQPLLPSFNAVNKVNPAIGDTESPTTTDPGLDGDSNVTLTGSEQTPEAVKPAVRKSTIFVYFISGLLGAGALVVVINAIVNADRIEVSADVHHRFPILS